MVIDLIRASGAPGPSSYRWYSRAGALPTVAARERVSGDVRFSASICIPRAALPITTVSRTTLWRRWGWTDWLRDGGRPSCDPGCDRRRLISGSPGVGQALEHKEHRALAHDEPAGAFIKRIAPFRRKRPHGKKRRV